MMRKLSILLLLLILARSQMLLSDTGSGVSEAGSLTSMPPSAPALVSPADGADGVISPDVTWNTATHAASYNLQVSIAPDFSTTLSNESDLTDTTYTVPGLSGGVMYYWHVSGTNVAGTGDYSGTWDFTTDASLPVTLASFSAEPVAGGILIQWTTESEIDNLGFILERTAGANNQPPQQWQTIASYQTHNELMGQGNTSAHTDYSFTDENVQPGQTYTYRLSDVNTEGQVHIDDVLEVSISNVPEMTVLEPPFPNPFNPQTTISYKLSDAGHVEIAVFDIMGRKVRTLLNKVQSAGSYTLYWHGQDNAGNQIADGTYLILLKTAEEVKKQKVALLH